MEQFTLTARLRETSGTSAARQFRREGLIPAVVYGHGQPVSNIVVSARDFGALLRHHGGGHVIALDVEGQAAVTDLAVLLKEMQRNPVTREILSADFQWVSLKEEVQVRVPVSLVGEAPGVAQEGGSLEQVMFEIEVACLPMTIPNAIEVDVSGLTMGHSLHVSDLVAPEGVRVLADADQTVVTVARPITAEDLETRVEEEGGIGGEAAEGEAAGASDE
jgi:large subunit ribosomal protein L25